MRSLTATELLAERRKSLKRRWPAIVVPVLHGFVLMLPILLGDLLHPARRQLLAPASGSRCSAIELVLYAVGTVFVIFMLVSERAVRAHKTAASIDPLTGMFNRRGFAEACARVIEREANAGRPVTVLIFDIDHFKSDQRPLRSSGGRRDAQAVRHRGDQQPAHHRSLGPDRRRGVRGAAAVLAGGGRGRRRAGARGLRGLRHRRSTTGRSTPPSASVSPAVPPAPSSKCCWPPPTPRSTRPSVAAVTASRPPRSCRCRWSTGGARRAGLPALVAAAAARRDGHKPIGEPSIGNALRLPFGFYHRWHEHAGIAVRGPPCCRSKPTRPPPAAALPACSRPRTNMRAR